MRKGVKRPLLWVFSAFIMGILLFQVFLHRLGQGGEPDGKWRDAVDAAATGVVDRVEEKENTTAVHLRKAVVQYDDGTRETGKQIILYCPKDKSYRIGNQMEAVGSLSQFVRPTNPGQLDEMAYYKSKGYSYKMMVDAASITDASYSRVREGIRGVKERLGNVYQSLLGEKEAGVVTAMMLGDKAELDEDVKELYGRNGISHILAISGLHVSLLGMLFFGAILRLKGSLRTASAATIVFLLAYGEMTGFGLSTNRAVLMLILTLVANIVGRTYEPQTALALGGCAALGAHPMALFQGGFLLSYGAVAGLLFVYPILESAVPDAGGTDGGTGRGTGGRGVQGIVDGMVKGVKCSLAVSIMTFPVLCYYFYEFPVYSILLNLVVIPCMGLVVSLSLLGGLAGLLSISLGRFLIGGVPPILNLYEALCGLAMRLPFHTVVTGRPKPYLIFVYYVVLSVLCVYYRRMEDETKWMPDAKQSPPFRMKKRLCLLGCLFLPVMLLLPHDAKGEMVITMLDVGQGDGIFIRMPKGTTIFIDGGSSDVKNLGRYRIEPFLKSQGVARLDYALLTHLDSDHTSGMKELMERMGTNGIRVGTLIMADVGDGGVSEAYGEMVDLAAEKGVKCVQMGEGAVFGESEAYFQCLHPKSGYVTESENDKSIVGKLTYGEFDMLLTGDVEEGGESLVVDKDVHPEEGYDVLKVAHHGSKSSTGEEFVEMCRPTLSLISSGWKNRYGHPSKDVVERLRDVGSGVVETTKHGAVTIRTDGRKVEVDGYLGGKVGEWECKG